MVEADPVNKDTMQAPTTITANKKYQCGRAIISTNETITTDIGTIGSTGHMVIRESDGTAVTHTVAGAVITITQATLTDVLVYWFAVST